MRRSPPHTPDTHTQELRDSEIIIRVTRDGLRPTFPPGCPAAFKDLAQACWSALPEDRPDMNQVRGDG